MPPHASKRLWEVDALRGLMLVLMTLTHLPTRLSSPFGQPFGFVSAAEGFVLLSAYMSGMVYGRRAWTASIGDMGSAFWRRALKVYACQAATLLFLFTVIAFIGVRVDQPAVKDLMSFYLQRPTVALPYGLALVYKPPLLDILPIYVLFMLTSPWAMVIALRWNWGWVVGPSLALWLLAQMGLGPWLYDLVSGIRTISVPFHETGAFSLFSWQFLWVLGLWMGATRNDPQAAEFRFPRWAVVTAVVVASVCLVWRHAIGQAPFEDNLQFNMLFDKWHLGPLRMLNLFAMMVVVIRFGPVLAARMPRVRWLETMGKASLPVFCAHLGVVLLVLGFWGNEERSWPQDIAILAGCFAILYLVARITVWMDRLPDEARIPAHHAAPPARTGGSAAA